ncbi:DNA-binding protein [Kitasatospora sp. NPDC101235]|uniref:DNA-binding protein n=1 Tax=Kitasatospora sp. NPDC101235 TaxID=3364101 RepID=UPI0037F319A0
MASTDHDHAANLDQARAALNAAGASELERRPWQPVRWPASDAELVRFAAWVAREPDTGAQVPAAGLRLLASARAELDQIEAGLLFAARGAGMTWPQIAGALGLDSPQAAQQRMHRLQARVADPTRKA